MRLGSIAGLVLAGAAAIAMPAGAVTPLRPSSPIVESNRPPRVKGKNRPKARQGLRSSRGAKKRERRAWANAQETQRQRTVAEQMASRAGVGRKHFYKQFGSLQRSA